MVISDRMPIVGELVALVADWAYFETDACGIGVVIHPWHGSVSKRATQLPRRNLGLLIIDTVEP